MNKAKAYRPTLAMRLDDAENRVQMHILDHQKAQDELRSSNAQRMVLSEQNTRLSKIIEGLKEDLFNKSLALAHLEGQLQRVDHEDAERAEVVQVQDVQPGSPIPIVKSVLKYELAKLSHPMRVMQATDFDPQSYEATDGTRSSYVVSTLKSKHWVNRH